jgi:hypothetical protein
MYLLACEPAKKATITIDNNNARRRLAKERCGRISGKPRP